MHIHGKSWQNLGSAHGALQQLRFNTSQLIIKVNPTSVVITVERNAILHNSNHTENNTLNNTMRINN